MRRSPRAAGALGDADRALLLEAMTQYPLQSANPVYDPEEYPDHWVNFLLPGLERVVPKERLRVANKIGRAYGFSVENAWIEAVPPDGATGKGFFLAAVIFNSDQILNDDRYDYATVADPFLADLGEVMARAFLVP